MLILVYFVCFKYTVVEVVMYLHKYINNSRLCVLSITLAAKWASS